MSKPIDSTVLSFRVISHTGATMSAHATRSEAAEATVSLVSKVTGQKFTIEGLPSVTGSVLTFRSVL